jgi:UDP-N-acetylmuramate: L-alanyl-gamma-D-glutamyl-meso-diaminopimelate ligase
VLDDFAPHPTAVRETIRAVRERFGTRRLVAVFEPRSNSSRRKVFQQAYAGAFGLADRILIPEPPLMDKVPPDERFSSRELVESLVRNGREALYFPNTDALLEELLRQSRPGDLVLFMSNGAFDNLPARLVKRLEETRCSWNMLSSRPL